MKRCALLLALLAGCGTARRISFEPSAKAVPPAACAADMDCAAGLGCSMGRCGPRPPPLAGPKPFLFAAAGDSRPAEAGLEYPQPIVARIFQEMGAHGPQLAVIVGDYVFVQPPNRDQAAQQLHSFLDAEAGFAAPVYYVLGNHDADPENLRAYRALLSPSLYYAFTTVVAPRPGHDSSLAKFVVVADNAWDDAQANWLDEVLSRPTDYTFVFRHHQASDGSSPPVLEVIERHPLTLMVVGHVHSYARSGDREVICGNGGSPLYDSYYGYCLVSQRSDGDVAVESWRMDTDSLADRFIVSPGD